MSGSTRRSPGKRRGQTRQGLAPGPLNGQADAGAGLDPAVDPPEPGLERPDPAPAPQPAKDPMDRLFAALCGDVLLKHASGQRVLDLGYGSPEVTAWIRRRSGRHLSIVERGLLESAETGLDLSEYPDASFDLVYALSIFPHLGDSAESSEHFARCALAEATRVLEPGGILAVEVANPRSLHGLQEGIRQPMIVASSKKLVSDRGGRVTRWETPARLRELAPETLQIAGLHGLGVFLPYRKMLSVPGFAAILRRAEWWARDRPLLQHFGRRLLILMRKQVVAAPVARPASES